MLGRTLDDAAGEAFDKGARLLGLGYPGRPELERLARDGDPAAYSFPVARLDGLDFSFSGVKTALLYAVKELAADELERRRADLAASYQRAIVDALVQRARAGSGANGGRPDRNRRRRRREHGVAGLLAGSRRGSARALHGQRGDDRLGRQMGGAAAVARTTSISMRTPAWRSLAAAAFVLGCVAGALTLWPSRPSARSPATWSQRSRPRQPGGDSSGLPAPRWPSGNA